MKVAAKVSAALRFASLLPTVRLMAQVTAVARTPIADLSKLTFEYFCAEKFVIGNDGDKAIDSEYAIAKRTKHT